LELGCGGGRGAGTLTMATQFDQPPVTCAPSTRTLAWASAAAVVVAGIILVVAVLPAEYGIDPLGAGRALGLTAMSSPADAAPAPVVKGAALVPIHEGQVASYPAAFKTDSRVFQLGPYEYVEYKYHLEKGATMLFSWNATQDVRADFHGDADAAKPNDEPTSYDDRRTRQRDGSFAAPFTGIHGWYWENLGGEPVTVTITTSGFYTFAREFHMDKTQRTYEMHSLTGGAPEQ
jgi:hypothetical protein